MNHNFLIMFPVWGIFTSHRKLPEFLWRISIDRKLSPVFFTDFDQATSFAEREIPQRPLTLIEFPDAWSFYKFIQLLQEQEVSFDPGKFSVHQAKICDLKKDLLENA